MRFLDNQAALGAAILFFSVPSQASHSHVDALGRRHSHHHRRDALTSPRAHPFGDAVLDVEKRGGSCAFPTNAGLVAVTPSQANAGWAMAPDMPCKPGMFCPYACPPGQLMGQWDPSVTSYGDSSTSVRGGLQCDSNGNINKPFPDKPYCYSGVGNVKVQNDCGGVHAVCQTVLPGYEDMLIPTEVDPSGSAVIAVPGPEYWLGTAAHFYHNPPGVSTQDGCLWGTYWPSQPVGNWAPYVSGANKDSTGSTFVKIGWNPVIFESGSPFLSTPPSWGIEILCPSGTNCNGLPCSIDPSKNKMNEVTSSTGASGAGGANFCVVTVPNGGSATIRIFNTGSSGGQANNNPPPQSSTSTAAPTHTTTSTSTSATTSSPATSSTSSSLSASSVVLGGTSGSSTQASVVSTVSVGPHVLFENATTITNGTSPDVISASTTSKIYPPTTLASAATATSTSKSAAPIKLISAGTAGFSALFAIAIGWLL